MTTEQTIATNAIALRNLAARLERMGYTGDVHAEAEHIALNLLADGWRPLDPPVPARGPGAKRASVDAAKAACEAAVRTAKERRKQPVAETCWAMADDENPDCPIGSARCVLTTGHGSEHIFEGRA